MVWIPVGLAAARLGGRQGRRSALRGLLAVVTATVAGRAVDFFHRDTHRPWRLWPRASRSSTVPTIASAVAITTATALEAPRLVVPVGALAAATVASACSVDCGRGRLAGASMLGATAALMTLNVWPRTHMPDAVPSSAPGVSTDQVSATGGGLAIVVNAAAGDPTHDDAIATITGELPDAVVLRIDNVEQLESEIARVAQTSRALGVLGGDGTVGAAAEAAIEADIPLAVFPGGTLNHFARDARVDTIDDAIHAVQQRRVVSIDTGLVDGRTFVNTASLGSYSTLVELRERHENTIGKWPAIALALIEMLADNQPVTLTINGTQRRLWMIFVGNCAYDPPGFAPAARRRLDDGLLDVRIVDADHPLARTRLVAALLTGRLARSAVYSRALLDRLDIDVEDSTPLLAADGETFPASAGTFSIEKNGRSLQLFVATG